MSNPTTERARALLDHHLGAAEPAWYCHLHTCPACGAVGLHRSSTDLRPLGPPAQGEVIHDLRLSCSACGWAVERLGDRHHGPGPELCGPRLRVALVRLRLPDGPHGRMVDAEIRLEAGPPELRLPTGLSRRARVEIERAAALANEAVTVPVQGLGLAELRPLLAEALQARLGEQVEVEVAALGPTRAELRAAGLAPEGLDPALCLEIGQALAMPPGRVRDRLIDRLRNRAGERYDYWIWEGRPVRSRERRCEIFVGGRWVAEGPGNVVRLERAERIDEDELRRRFRLEV